jgi:hypothetical protein
VTPALLLSPLVRWGALAVLLAALMGWGAVERAGRQAATAEAALARAQAASLAARIQHMETRREAEDNAARSSNPAGELRDRWRRAD